MKLKRYELIELQVANPNGPSQFPFLDIPDLRDDTTQDIIVTGLEAFSIENMPLSPEGNLTPTTAQLLNSFLVLYIDGEESVYRVPVVRLMPVFANGVATVRANFAETELENLRIVWNKSYIQLGTPFIGAAAFSYIFGVTYKKLPAGAWAQMTMGKIPGW
jgi:hypothetical protein